MNEQEKKEYLEKYEKAKKAGLPFYPDILFKDAVVSLIIFLILVSLAYFVGAQLEARADPTDTNYTPRPEWYFLFLFQLLKYFPGSIEFLGVFLLPALGIILLFTLPFLDSSPKRHFLSRPVISGITLFAVFSIALLSIQAYREAPIPTAVVQGDEVAALYAENCAGCHGAKIDVGEDTNLHSIISQGKHEGMPAWNADLSTDQIDALAGFILSPGGNELYVDNCSKCHNVSELVAGDPLELKNALEQGSSYLPHAGLDIPEWTEVLDIESRTKLLNFLAAPDGQRLYAINCSPCHGSALGYSGDEEQLAKIISEGGQHLEMPAWQERLNPRDLDELARYVVDPSSSARGKELFDQHCSDCHGERIPQADSVDTARDIIQSGGPHEVMPVWGDSLTAEQLDALVSYTINVVKGTSSEIGQQLFASNCASCHGEFGEGGPNPTRPDDIIAPISTAEYLNTRDDFTLRAVISQGQPNFGMSPFGSSFGGPLEDDQIDAVVAYIRSWQDNPPVELPPEVITSSEQISLNGSDIYSELCSQCHGVQGEGGTGPPLSAPEFQEENSDQEIFDSINLGHEATPMIAWGAILTSDQIQQLVEVIRNFKAEGTTSQAEETAISFNEDVIPLFDNNCAACHGTFGGWDASTYESVMTTGNNAPVIIPGDVENSLLIHKLMGTQTEGSIMPPSGKLPDSEIQIIIDWIYAGALDN
ncbi:MAG: c-type cytochrome [Anaerolineales bacterium]